MKCPVAAVLVLMTCSPAAQAPSEPANRCVQNCGDTVSTPPPAARPNSRANPARERERAAQFSLDEGIVYFNRGAWDNAIRSFTEALEKSPNDRDVQDWLARARAARTAGSAAGGRTSFTIPDVSVRGAVYLITSDGRRIAGDKIPSVPLDNRARIVTGPDGHLVLHLPDATLFTINANSDLTIDEFVYDPRGGKVVAHLMKGAFRWVTGKLRPLARISVSDQVIIVGIRGTDFEVEVQPDGSGYIRMLDGLIEYTRKGSSIVETLQTNQTFRFAASQ